MLFKSFKFPIRPFSTNIPPHLKKLDFQISAIGTKYKETQSELNIKKSSESLNQNIDELNNTLKALKSVFRISQKLEIFKKQREYLASFIEKTSEDEDLIYIAKEEKEESESNYLKYLEEILTHLKNSNKPAKPQNKAILEVTAGVGGNESKLFATEIFEMYRQTAATANWKCETVLETKDDLGGLKHGILLLDGKEAFLKLKREIGCHRVQRVPVTEHKGRLQTSIVKVSVNPEAEKTAVTQIKKSDLKIDTYRASGPGGQHVNKTESAVRITHIPSGIVCACENGRSQHKNKDMALRILTSKLQIQEELERSKLLQSEQKKNFFTGDRSEKIRSYNWNQDRVTDHRVKISFSGVQRVLCGSYLFRIWEKLEEKENEELISRLTEDEVIYDKIKI